MKTVLKFSIITLIGITTFSCSTYEEGPGISIRSRTERVANLWIITSASSDGEDISSDFERYELLLNKDGDAELDASFKLFGETYKSTTDGTWEFTNDENNISLDFEDDDFDNSYQILLLKENEMKLRQQGEDLELVLMSK